MDEKMNILANGCDQNQTYQRSTPTTRRRRSVKFADAPSADEMLRLSSSCHNIDASNGSTNDNAHCNNNILSANNKSLVNTTKFKRPTYSCPSTDVNNLNLMMMMSRSHAITLRSRSANSDPNKLVISYQRKKATGNRRMNTSETKSFADSAKVLSQSDYNKYYCDAADNNNNINGDYVRTGIIAKNSKDINNLLMTCDSGYGGDQEEGGHTMGQAMSVRYKNGLNQMMTAYHTRLNRATRQLNDCRDVEGNDNYTNNTANSNADSQNSSSDNGENNCQSSGTTDKKREDYQCDDCNSSSIHELKHRIAYEFLNDLEMAKHVKECVRQFNTGLDMVLQGRQMVESSQLPIEDKEQLLKYLNQHVTKARKRLEITDDRYEPDGGRSDSPNSISSQRPNPLIARSPSGESPQQHHQLSTNPQLTTSANNGTDVDLNSFLQQHRHQLVALLEKNNMAKQN